MLQQKWKVKFITAYWNSTKEQGRERRNRRGGGRGGKCVRTKTLDNTNLMIGDQSKKKFKVICKHDIMWVLLGVILFLIKKDR